jgi:hypothetical protein
MGTWDGFLPCYCFAVVGFYMLSLMCFRVCRSVTRTDYLRVMEFIASLAGIHAASDLLVSVCSPVNDSDVG